MNITEEQLDELEQHIMTACVAYEKPLPITSIQEQFALARQGLRLQEVEKWKAEQQQALITMAATLLSAGFKGDHVVHGVKWLACELEAAKRDTERLELLALEFNRFFSSAFFKPPLNNIRDAIDKFDHAINAERKSK